MNPLNNGALPTVWVEKTKLRKMRSQEFGDLGIGKNLWSPRVGTDGGDRYPFMRRVKLGDIVLHLTDRQAFTAVSRVAGPLEILRGGSAENPLPADRCRIRLDEVQKLVPPLDRDVFFGSSFGERLKAVVKSGQHHVFFSHVAKLRQGAYLTPCPPAVIGILNDAYRAAAGRPLLSEFESAGEKPRTVRAGDLPPGLGTTLSFGFD